MNLEVKYAGLTLKNPIIAGSSGHTAHIGDMLKLEEAGAAAIVLKSIFEEEIFHEFEKEMNDLEFGHELSEHFDYFDYQIRQTNIANYLALIKEAKSKLSIPVIASVNCVYSHEWTFFAKKLEESGADAIELNMFYLPSDLSQTSEEKEEKYFTTIHNILHEVSIPVTLKISHYFTSLGTVIKALSETGIQGMVLFNRFYSPDFDIEQMEVKPSFVFSNEKEYAMPLRWIAIMYGKTACDLVASTGIHSGETAIKMLLAGATAVQVASVVYEQGFGAITSMLNDIQEWMKRKGFESIDDFRGKLSWNNVEDPAVFERVQFMKYFK